MRHALPRPDDRPRLTAPGSLLVVGLGNSSRADDAAGLEAARLVAEARPDLRVMECTGDVLPLVDAWDGVSLLVVIDAARSGATAGTVRRLTESALTTASRRRHATASSHGLGLVETLALGRALGGGPGRVVVYTVEGARFGPGERLSPAVRAGVRHAVQRVLDEVDGVDSAAS